MYISEEDESPVQKMKCKACASGAGDSLHFMGECVCRRRWSCLGGIMSKLLVGCNGKEEREGNGSGIWQRRISCSFAAEAKHCPDEISPI